MPDGSGPGRLRTTGVRAANVRMATMCGRLNAIVTVLLAVGLTLGTQVAGAGASTASSKAQAKKMLLVLSDMPKGWKKEKG